MRRIRRAAPKLIVFGAYLMTVTLSLAAADAAVTNAEMKTFVYETMAFAGAFIVGAAGGLIAWILARDREITGKRFDQVVTALSDLASGQHRVLRALEAHNECTTAHTAAAEHNHGPMREDIKAISEKLDNLLMEHRIIRGSEDEVCMLVRSLAEKRSPMESPNISRKTDANGLDHRPEQGPK